MTFWVIFAFVVLSCPVHSPFPDPDSEEYFISHYLSLSRGMMTMLLSVIFLLLASTLAQEDDCPANDNSPSCDDPAEQTICQLTCNRASGACAQYDEAKCGQIGVDVTNEAYPDMFATRCKAICEASRDSESAQDVCRFYKVSVCSSCVSFPPFI